MRNREELDNSEPHSQAQMRIKHLESSSIDMVKVHRNPGVEVLGDFVEQAQIHEQLRKQNEELIKLNAEKDKLISVIAHDLRSPFNGLLGLAEMMASDDYYFSAADLKKHNKMLFESLSNIYALLDNLLEWSMVAGKSREASPKRINLCSLVANCIEISKLPALRKNIKIINKVDDQWFVFVDQRMIASVLDNLLSNAVKFTNRDGFVIAFAQKTANNMIEVSITDTGVGIPTEDFCKLFKIEQGVRSKGTEGELSTGLGLLLCKEFVEKNNGNIGVVSKEGSGSTFSFTLPLSTQE